MPSEAALDVVPAGAFPADADIPAAPNDAVSRTKASLLRSTVSDPCPPAFAAGATPATVNFGSSNNSGDFPIADVEPDSSTCAAVKTKSTFLTSPAANSTDLASATPFSGSNTRTV